MTAPAEPPSSATPPPARRAWRWLDDDAGSPRPTELTRSLLNALDRAPVHSIIPTTFITVLGGLLTAGIYPAVALPFKWSRTLRWHHNLVWHLAEWLKLNVGEEEGAQLHRATGRGTPLWLARGAMLLGLAALVLAVWGVASGVAASEYWFVDPRDPLDEPLTSLFLGSLLGAYMLNWLSVNLHLLRLRRVRKALDATTPHLPPTPGLKVSRWEAGVRPVPAALGLILAVAGMIWALPMLIAGTAQRRALLIHHRRFRSGMAHRVRDLVGSRRPLVALPPVVDRTGMCRNGVCDQVLPPDARFCPRCGTPQRPVGRALE